MQMLYNSDQFAVVQFEAMHEGVLARGGFEIVDKLARTDTFIEGALAEQFEQGVNALVAEGPSEEKLDEFIAGFTVLAQHPLVLH